MAILAMGKLLTTSLDLVMERRLCLRVHRTMVFTNRSSRIVCSPALLRWSRTVASQRSALSSPISLYSHPKLSSVFSVASHFKIQDWIWNSTWYGFYGQGSHASNQSILELWFQGNSMQSALALFLPDHLYSVQCRRCLLSIYSSSVGSLLCSVLSFCHCFHLGFWQSQLQTEASFANSSSRRQRSTTRWAHPTTRLLSRGTGSLSIGLLTSCSM